MSADRDHDADADDLLVDLCLGQELGGHTPRDHAAHVAAATPAARARAAARVDAAAALRAEAPTGRHAGRIVLAIAASLTIALAAWWAVDTWLLPPGNADQRAQALLDEFHSVMPNDPASLHDEPRRRDLAVTALPVLREILGLHAARPDETVFGRRIFEFEVYAAILGDAATRASIRQRAAAGDGPATAQLALTSLITTGSEPPRSQLLRSLAEQLTRQPELSGSITQCLVAAELSLPEAEQLAASIADADLARYLLRAAERSAASPRRLLGQPLELFGTLADDRRYSTTSLAGRTVLVCFWATWCRPSLATMSELTEIRSRFPELAMVGVSCDNDRRALRNYLADHREVDWPQFFDRARPGWHELATASGVHALPFVLLIDRQGRVCEVDVGSNVEAAVRRHLDR